MQTFGIHPQAWTGNAPPRRPSAVLADDHPLVLAGLGTLLAPTLDLVATASDGEALLAATLEHRPDLVITDISMPGLDGLEALRRLRSLTPATKVIVLTCHAEAAWAQAALEAGAAGYLTKTAAPTEIDTAVALVLAGHCYIASALTRALLALRPPASSATTQTKDTGSLTPREEAISKLVGQGLHNKEIARQLGISVTTVRTHLSSVYLKLGGVSRLELALQSARCANGNG